MNLSGSPFDFVLAFLGGVIVSFTPCVYPLVPISAGYIGTTATCSKLQGFILSIIYVTGIAVTYSVLGLIASFTGQLFGKISSHPITNIVVGGIIILLGLSMFDMFHVPFVNTTAARLHNHKKHDYFSTFVLGVTSGLVVGPCLTPVLGAILAYLTTKNNILYGVTLLFSFAFGMGLILILIGTFSALVIRLPKAGKWLTYVKRFGAAIILVTGVYFVWIGIRRL